MPRPKAIRALRNISRPTAATTVSYRCRMLARWAWVGAPVLAEADRHHLEEARLELALEVRVRLDPVDHADPVGLGCFAVEPDGEAEGLADLHDGHRRRDLGG